MFLQREMAWPCAVGREAPMFAWSSPGHWTNRPSMNMCRAPDIKSTFGNHLECIWEPDAPGCTCMHHPNRNHINGVSASSRKRLVSPSWAEPAQNHRSNVNRARAPRICRGTRGWVVAQLVPFRASRLYHGWLRLKTIHKGGLFFLWVASLRSAI